MKDRLGIVRAFAAGADVMLNRFGDAAEVAHTGDELARMYGVTVGYRGAVFHATRAAVPAMKARGWDCIINVASVHGLLASPFKSAYVAAKHGVVGLTKVIALELAGTGIARNAICPGYVRTPLVEKQIDDQTGAHGVPREEVVRDVLLKDQPNKRFATVEEMGGLAVFLCSDLAASLTGTALPAGRPDAGSDSHDR